MNDKEKATSNKSQASADPDYPQGIESNTPVGSSNQDQQSPTQQSPTQAGGPQVSGDTSQQPKKPCVKTDDVKDNLEKQKWDNQRNQIESQCDQALNECIKKSNNDSLKLHNDLEVAVMKYREEFEKIKHQFDCIDKNNESALENIPADYSKEIDEIIKKACNKIKELKSCKEKLECAVEAECDCDNSKYQLLDQKPQLDLECTEEGRKKLKTLMSVKDELERSGRYHDSLEQDFNDTKNTQTAILDNLKKVGDYQTKAQKAKDEGKLCQVYAYTLLIKMILDETNKKFVDKETLEKNLTDALKKLIAAKVDKCYREFTKNKAEAMLNFINQNLEEADKTRDDAILKKIVNTRM